ncbi:MAG: RsmB/NOP family class I SAM-dependent RNA methyltransferase [Alphaproteobacteria bacterium]|jgi:16S rRNA (cytosine967-C5)-methyltransferase|nr:RsmB/NOP family class I SAM-dependent RNA methyltransferase [Alphaproteobacteria bacterium]MBT4019777.1 RsmB/NOP family class I SAM-dependent RNA methyltransferase [Alphaproteobacteria bacterium]MBT4965489.1 RsmB/NOP family class I SAM-dependent RNA methyltransferase [Alphaproteobacteria bacterium]MBT5158584.1 RsmB/NOP family class I SAM-dependent RNA methyltransferase [Alphaproteobacteria bacterium]MBT5917580.1 RsmB/NOP family class I SAM-dependent RNA methyltransferase [Alphaproteobacteria
MTPGARADMSMDILRALDVSQRPADRLIDQWFRDRRFAGSGDRRFISGLVYQILRRRSELIWLIGDYDAGEEVDGMRMQVVAALSHLEGWTAEDFDKAFSGAGHNPSALNEDEKLLLKKISIRRNQKMPLPVQGNFPDWMEPHLVRRFEDDLMDQMSAMNERAAVDLRVNTLKTNRDDALAALAEAGFDAEPGTKSLQGIRLNDRKRITGTALYIDGGVEIQDEAAQLCAALVDAQPGQTVLDACTGAGGKALALAAAMNNKGHIEAWDVDDRRLERLLPRLDRAGIKIVSARKVRADGSDLYPDYQGAFDRVLIDAPCSGTGTWRRNPETKWRLTAETLQHNVDRQAKIMKRAADLVKPGGRLIYATCSVLDCEGADQIHAFLSLQPDFSVLPVSEIWSGADAGSDFLKLSPHSNGTDGFFVAVLARSDQEPHEEHEMPPPDQDE